ncbi:DUF1963 domain-containing protein [Actinomadura flavalba]|uniref:DUF1963 domain-containing protein n=1 Tax=Actinomadura flavalba TaxID=1120938 RepID=UPI00036C042B|nr:DUF1963 domain-containing protein [Actinomadura flavalba]
MNQITVQRRRLVSLFSLYLVPEVAAMVLALARPGLLLRRGGPPAVWLGGSSGDPPVWRGRALQLLAVVDFAALPRVGGFPFRRQAAFFCAGAAARPWGDVPDEREAWRVRSHGAPHPSGRPRGVVPFLSLPSPAEPVVRRLEAVCAGFLAVYENLYTAWSQYVWPANAPRHQLGGWPVTLSGPLRPAAPARSGPPSDDDQWRLVVQLDGDPELGWHWGDPGRVFFTVRPRGTLGNAWLTAQVRAPAPDWSNTDPGWRMDR